jgi:phospholipase C
MSQSEKQFTNVLDTFDHVVVLMLENRSFDNLLGYLYSQKYPVPPGQQFEGVDGKTFPIRFLTPGSSRTGMGRL